MIVMSKERDYAFSFLYHLPFEDIRDGCLDLLEDFEKSYSADEPDNSGNTLNSRDKKRARALLEKTLEVQEQVRILLEEKIKRRSLEKLDRVEASLLLLGATELMQAKTPPKVVINEYILLAKKYGSKKSSSFVNGVLDAIYKNQ